MMRWKEIKLGVYAFFVVLLVCMVGLKPHLPRAIFHNFAKIDQYPIFANRVVKASDQPRTWEINTEVTFPDPNPETSALLSKLKTTALLVIDHEKIVYEKYWEGGGIDTLSGSFSMAKSIVALLAGAALDEGTIRIDDKISRYFPEWEDRDEGRITVKQLLTMTAGLNWNESYYNPFSITTESYYGENLLATAFKQRLERDPGTYFSYQSGTTLLLGLLISRATNQSLAKFASIKLWQPLQAKTDALWSLDHEGGVEKAFCCFNATARDFARFGQLMLNRGKWGGETVISEAYMDAMLSPHLTPNEEGKPTDYYGYQTWILPTKSGNIPYFRGILGQFVVAIPSKQRVVVRLGKKTGVRVDHQPEELKAIVDWALNAP